MAYIQDDEAYNAAISRRIKANSWKTNANWVNEGDHATLIAFLEKNTKNEFYKKLYYHYQDYGKLSDAQAVCVRKGIEKKALQAAERAQNSPSKHVGIIGARQDFTLSIVHVSQFQTHFSYYGEIGYVYVCNDAEGNVVVYMGSKEFTFDEGDCGFGAVKGDTLVGKATVKKHEVREGINQTLVSRPTFKVVRK